MGFLPRDFKSLASAIPPPRPSYCYAIAYAPHATAVNAGGASLLGENDVIHRTSRSSVSCVTTRFRFGSTLECNTGEVLSRWTSGYEGEAWSFPGLVPNSSSPRPHSEKMSEKFCTIRSKKLAFEGGRGHICNSLEVSPPWGFPVGRSRGDESNSTSQERYPHLSPHSYRLTASDPRRPPAPAPACRRRARLA